MLRDRTFYGTMPAIVSLPYGLKREWTVRVEDGKRVIICIPMRSGWDTPPNLAIGVVLGSGRTEPVALKVSDGMAIALIDLGDRPERAAKRGQIKIFAVKTDDQPLLKEPSLLYGLVYGIVALATGVRVARRARQGYGEISKYVAALPQSPA